ncbi:hypothetical protein POR1_79 [Pseudomonas phage POR1]|uniref:Uncharacterized protein n=1 Tax=Pseudomonas phage POR1 TaxID=1718594 RepID=A0A0N9SSJ6_9CAUD|nr:hypothetical protein POR1_79 [Pseudomonas phage POR1]
MRNLTIYQILDCTEIETLQEMARDVLSAVGVELDEGCSISGHRKRLRHIDTEKMHYREASLIQQAHFFLLAIERRMGELYLRRLRPSTREEAERNEKRLHEGRH